MSFQSSSINCGTTGFRDGLKRLLNVLFWLISFYLLYTVDLLTFYTVLPAVLLFPPDSFSVRNPPPPPPPPCKQNKLLNIVRRCTKDPFYIFACTPSIMPEVEYSFSLGLHSSFALLTEPGHFSLVFTQTFLKDKC